MNDYNFSCVPKKMRHEDKADVRTFCAVSLNALTDLLRNWKDLDSQPSTSPVFGQLALRTLPDSAEQGSRGRNRAHENNDRTTCEAFNNTQQPLPFRTYTRTQTHTNTHTKIQTQPIHTQNTCERGCPDSLCFCFVKIVKKKHGEQALREQVHVLSPVRRIRSTTRA